MGKGHNKKAEMNQEEFAKEIGVSVTSVFH